MLDVFIVTWNTQQPYGKTTHLTPVIHRAMKRGWEGCSIQWSGGGVGISTPFDNNVHLIIFSFFLISHQTGWTALVCRLLEKLAKNR